jgi:hypothetical protein
MDKLTERFKTIMARKPVTPRARRPNVNDTIKAARNAKMLEDFAANRKKRRDARNAGKAPAPSGGNPVAKTGGNPVAKTGGNPVAKTGGNPVATTGGNPVAKTGGSSSASTGPQAKKLNIRKDGNGASRAVGKPTPSQVNNLAERTGLPKARVLSLLSRGAGATAFMAGTVAAINYLESKVPEKNPKTVDPRIAKNKRANEAGDRARAKAIANGASPEEANQARAAEMKKRRSVSSVKPKEVTANEPKEVTANKPKETKASNRVVPDPVPSKGSAKAAASNIGSSTGSSKKAPVPRKRPSKGTTAKELYNLGKDAEKKVEVNKAVTEAKKKSRIVQDYDYMGDKY